MPLLLKLSSVIAARCASVTSAAASTPGTAVYDFIAHLWRAFTDRKRVREVDQTEDRNPHQDNKSAAE